MKRKLRKAVVWLVMLVISISPVSIQGLLGVQPVAAATNTTTTVSVSNQVVKLTPKSSVSLRDAHFLMQEQGKVLAFTMTFNNKESKSLDLLDYWIRLKNASGKVYAVKQVNSEKAVKSVVSTSSVNVAYYAMVDVNTSINDLKFEIIKWDFSRPNYERSMGTIKYPKGLSEKIEPYKSKVMLYDNTKLNGVIKTYDLSTTEEDTTIAIEYMLENKGYRSSSMTKLKFFIQTNNQTYVYDVTTEDLSKISLQPNESKTITLNATLPKGTSTKDMVLVVSQANNETIPYLPIGVFKLPTKSSTPSQAQGKIGSTFRYKEFDATLTSIQRISSGDHDSLVAKVKVTNRSASSKELLNLSGYLLVNGLKITSNPSNMSLLDQAMLVVPDESYSYAVYVDIPTSLSISKVGFMLTEQGDTQGANAKDLFKFEDSKLTAIPVKTSDIPYSIQNTSSKAQVKLLNSEIYPGDKADHFYAEVEYQNSENKLVAPLELNGYLSSTGKPNMPITVSKYTEKVFPGGKVILSLYAKVPKNYLTDNVRLTIGQSLKTPESSAKQASTLIDPVTYPIIASGTYGTKSSLTEVRYMGYLINFVNIYPSLHGKVDAFSFDGLNLDFFYDLYQVDEYENGTDKHKLLIEFVDSGNEKATYSKELSFDELTEGAEYIKEGVGIGKKITFMDSDIINKLTMTKYKINIYHVYEQNKMLIASKEMIW